MSIDQQTGRSWQSKAIIIGTIIGGTVVLIMALGALRPQAEKREIPETIVKVDVVSVAPTSYPILVNTSGTVQADTRGNLVAQIRGEIVKESEAFRAGGSFKKGEVLREIDPRDYAAELSQASAAVSQADAAYRQEQANARQARNDWDRLGNTGDAPDLVLRKPQLAAAKAQLESASARLETAQLNLERTKITAPYDGRIIQRNAVLGQYVGVGTPVAEIFSTDRVEVRLPLSQTEFTQLGLDGAFGGDSNESFKVTLSSQVGTNTYTWDAVLSRADSTFDLNTRQIDVFARVIEPFATESGRPALKIGQFVNAQVQGQTLDNVMVVPNKSIREGSYVFVSVDNILERTPVKIAWQDDQNALIETGLNTGDLVVTTSLNSTLAGATVKLDKEFGNPGEAMAVAGQREDEAAESSDADGAQNASSSDTESSE
mgnify:CR=1 FL=1